MDRLIYIGTMGTGILFKILCFNSLMLIPTMNNMTSYLTVVLDMQLPYKLISTILHHLNLFKYKNMIFNLNNVTKIHADSSLVG